MLGFHLDLVGQALRLLALREWRVTSLGAAAMLIVLVNGSFATLLTGWEGISPWWALVPAVALLGYGIVQVNYELCDRTMQALEAERQEVQRLHALLNERGQQEAVSMYISQLHEGGERLRREILYAEDELQVVDWDRQWNSWRLAVREYLKENVSPARAAYVDAIETYDASSLVREGRPASEARAVIAQNIDGRLRRLREILAETEAVLSDLTRTPTRPH